MRYRSVAVSLSLAALVAACSDGVGPNRTIAGRLTLDFCSNESPVFFAYRNDGGNWTSVSESADNSFTFDVTEKVGIAMTFDFGDEILTDVYYATRTELLPLSDKACNESVGAKTVNGSVSNVATGEQAYVSMGGSEIVVAPPPSTFSLTSVPSGPQDLIAHREVTTIEGLAPDRVVIRRAQNPVSGATLAALDFSAATSDPLTVNLASITGLTGGEDNYLDVYFETALGTEHTLWLAPLFSTSTQTLYGIPAALTQSGDLHRLDLQAEATSGATYRVVRRWYRNPANQSLSLGPNLPTPGITSAGTTPYLRLRASLPSQPDYGSFATAYFIQGTSFLRSVFVTETSGYRGGTPATWTLEIPNLSSTGDYPADAGLVSGSGTQWFVEAFDGSLGDFIGSTPTEGATVRWAGRTSSVTLLRAEGSAGERSRGRPAFLDQRVIRRK
jgi:hypothetical protein